MKVRATELGFYGLQRRREGDVFELDKPEHFSHRWMEPLDLAAMEAARNQPKVPHGYKPWEGQKAAKHPGSGQASADSQKPAEKEPSKKDGPATGDQQVI